MTILVHGFPASTAIDRVRYDPATQTLDLWYAGGERYSYFDVPQRVYEQLIAAPSAGAFVNERIKPCYRYEIEARRKRFRPA